MNEPSLSTGATAPACISRELRKFREMRVNSASGSFSSSNIMMSATANVTANTSSMLIILSSMYSFEISTFMWVFSPSSELPIFSETLYSLLRVSTSEVSAYTLTTLTFHSSGESSTLPAR